MSQEDTVDYKPDLVGKRVKHDCGDPNCTLTGIVMDVVFQPDKSLRGKQSDWWAVVKFDPHEGLPLDYTQPFPVSRVKVIEE